MGRAINIVILRPQYTILSPTSPPRYRRSFNT
jgi:hypothetical protein